MPVEVAAGAALSVVVHLLPQPELRRQCYEAVLRHAGYSEFPSYDEGRAAIARTHRDLPPEPPAWIKTDTGCEVGLPFTDPDVARGLSARWSGACVAGKASGHGELVFTGPGGTARYRGDLSNGVPEGRGVFEAYGNRYEGDFHGGLPDGRGVMTYATGERWEGDFRIGEPHGWAVFTDKKGNRYEGNFAHGKPEGYGKTFYVSGNRYEGEYSNGMRNGRGTFYQADGGRYEGEWRDDKRYGHGILISPTGRRFEGEFVDDKPAPH